jgi:hypothetical protein
MNKAGPYEPSHPVVLAPMTHHTDFPPAEPAKHASEVEAAA